MKNIAVQTAIESTMVGPLWARANFSQLYPDLLNDNEAARIYKEVVAMHPEAADQFLIMQKNIGEFLGLNFLIRARIFDDTIKEFIKKHSEATVVNIGCGLDTTFFRVDNGKIIWYDLDLPDAIEYRKKLIHESPRNFCIPKSVFDYSWFDDIQFSLEKGIFFFAGGLFNYFKEQEVSALCKLMAERFPSGELIFDVPSKIGNKFMNRKFKKFGIKFYFGLANPKKQILKWSNKIQVVDWFTIFARTKRNPKWKRKTRLMMNFVDRFKFGKFAHVRFLT